MVETECRTTELPESAFLRPKPEKSILAVGAFLLYLLVFVALVKLTNLWIGIGVVLPFPIAILLLVRSANVIGSRGVQCLNAGQLDDAESYLYRAARRSRWFPAAHATQLHNLAALELRRGHVDTALALLSSCVVYFRSLSPLFKGMVAVHLAESWAFRGDTEAAECWLQRAKEDAADFMPTFIRNTEAIVRCRQGRYLEAISICREDPGPDDLHYAVSASMVFWQRFAEAQSGHSQQNITLPSATRDLVRNNVGNWPALKKYVDSVAISVSEPAPKIAVAIVDAGVPKGLKRYFWTLVGVLALVVGGFSIVFFHDIYVPISVDDALINGLPLGLTLAVLWFFWFFKHFRKWRLSRAEVWSLVLQEVAAGVMGFAILGIAVTSGLNGYLDSSRPVPKAATVFSVSPRPVEKGRATCLVRFSSPLGDDVVFERVYSGKIANRLLSGAKTIVFLTHPGALGIPWTKSIHAE